MSNKTLFKISFVNQGKIYEIFARQVSQSSIYSFVEVDELVFEEKSSLVVDPSEEKLKNEFNGVKRTYIPTHSIIRIDEVEQRGTAKIINLNGKINPASALYPGLMNQPKPD